MAAARLDELESRVAFQEDTIEQLSEAVARQDRELAELKRQLKAVVERLQEMDAQAADAGPASEFEVPPHY